MDKYSSNVLVTNMQQWFDKAPALPAKWRELLVSITPYIALIFGVLGVLTALAGVGLLTAFAPLAVFGGMPGVSSYGGGFIAAILWLVSSALLLAAFPGTRAKKKSGWTLLFWSEVVNLIGAVVALSFVSGIIGALIGFYLLFQIKSYYH
jgi:hypothetical protein